MTERIVINGRTITTRTYGTSERWQSITLVPRGADVDAVLDSFAWCAAGIPGHAYATFPVIRERAIGAFIYQSGGLDI